MLSLWEVFLVVLAAQVVKDLVVRAFRYVLFDAEEREMKRWKNKF